MRTPNSALFSVPVVVTALIIVRARATSVHLRTSKEVSYSDLPWPKEQNNAVPAERTVEPVTSGKVGKVLIQNAISSLESSISAWQQAQKDKLEGFLATCQSFIERAKKDNREVTRLTGHISRLDVAVKHNISRLREDADRTRKNIQGVLSSLSEYRNHTVLAEEYAGEAVKNVSEARIDVLRQLEEQQKEHKALKEAGKLKHHRNRLDDNTTTNNQTDGNETVNPDELPAQLQETQPESPQSDVRVTVSLMQLESGLMEEAGEMPEVDDKLLATLRGTVSKASSDYDESSQHISQTCNDELERLTAIQDLDKKEMKEVAGELEANLGVQNKLKFLIQDMKAKHAYLVLRLQALQKLTQSIGKTLAENDTDSNGHKKHKHDSGRTMTEP